MDSEDMKRRKEEAEETLDKIEAEIIDIGKKKLDVVHNRTPASGYPEVDTYLKRVEISNINRETLSSYEATRNTRYIFLAK